jgi:type IV secretory pathway TrbD component
VSTAKVVVLFVVGLLLAVLVFPVAFFVSAALGYIFGVIALVVGVWLAVKRAGKTLPLV